MVSFQLYTVNPTKEIHFSTQKRSNVRSLNLQFQNINHFLYFQLWNMKQNIYEPYSHRYDDIYIPYRYPQMQRSWWRWSVHMKYQCECVSWRASFLILCRLLQPPPTSTPPVPSTPIPRFYSCVKPTTETGGLMPLAQDQPMLLLASKPVPAAAPAIAGPIASSFVISSRPLPLWALIHWRSSHLEELRG